MYRLNYIYRLKWTLGINLRSDALLLFTNYDLIVKWFNGLSNFCGCDCLSCKICVFGIGKFKCLIIFKSSDFLQLDNYWFAVAYTCYQVDMSIFRGLLNDWITATHPHTKKKPSKFKILLEGYVIESVIISFTLIWAIRVDYL